MLDGQQLQSLLLRIGLAFVFAYAAVSAFFEPLRFAGYMPSFLPHRFVEQVCLPFFSAYELILAVLLLAGVRLFVVSMLSAVTVVGIIVINLDLFPLLFRNVAILCAALALAVQAREAQLRAKGTAPVEEEQELPQAAVAGDERVD